MHPSTATPRPRNTATRLSESIRVPWGISRPHRRGPSVHVGDDDVRDVLRPQSERLERVGRLDEVFYLPLREKVAVREAGINQDVMAIPANQPDHHGDVQLAGRIGSGHELRHGKVG